MNDRLGDSGLALDSGLGIFKVGSRESPAPNPDCIPLRRSLMCRSRGLMLAYGSRS